MLCIGGPLDGKYVELNKSSTLIVAVEPQFNVLKTEKTGVCMPLGVKYVRYKRDALYIKEDSEYSKKVYIMIPEDQTYSETMAKLLNGYRVVV